MAALVSVAMGMMLAGGLAADGPPSVPSATRLPTILDLRLTTAEPRAPRLPRLSVEPMPLDLLPGDRPTSELCADTTERPRLPGTPVKARMSMRLDDGRDSMRPAFALGGLGGALVRMTDALLDD
ncbi:hypothetical protein [uncultured Sphingomonas sp.]|uniref:hypothetical protein n=1 Tax=uncultured Sphingomonas sp. TaxID=158754 RepID=UPI0026000C42|nr:hypothetical protein [uncultured Sphingomonas sp.]